MWVLLLNRLRLYGVQMKWFILVSALSDRKHSEELQVLLSKYYWNILPHSK